VPRLRLAGREADLDAVIFDVGGTLLHLDHAFIAARSAGHGAPVSARALARGEARARAAVDRLAAERDGALERDAARLPRYLADLLGAAGVAAPRAARVAAALVADHARENLWRVPAPDAAGTLAALRTRGFRTAVVSNADGRAARQLAAAGLAAHVEAVLDSHEEGVEKPDPEIFRRALARLGVVAARAAYVGDIRSIDVAGARAAGLVPVLIDTTRLYGADAGHGADCATLAALAELLG